jgi:hypothetical protein
MLTEVGLIVQAILDLVVELLPQITGGSTSAVAKAVVLLDKIVPTIIAAFPNLITSVQGIISALQSSGNLTGDQMTALEKQAADLDAALLQAGKDEDLTDPLAPTTAT